MAARMIAKAIALVLGCICLDFVLEASTIPCSHMFCEQCIRKSMSYVFRFWPGKLWTQ